MIECLCSLIMRQSTGNKCLVFSRSRIRLERRGSLFADLSRVVIEGSSGLVKRVERQDDGSRTDFKNWRESCSRRSAGLGMAAQYNALMQGNSM